MSAIYSDAERFAITIENGQLTSQEAIKVACSLSDLRPNIVGSVATITYQDLSTLTFKKGRVYPRAYSNEEN